MSAYVKPMSYVTYFLSSNGRVVELYKDFSSGMFQVHLNNCKVAEASKHLAFEWLRALVKPEYHQDIERLYKEL